MNEHTPTPWHIAESKRNGEIIIRSTPDPAPQLIAVIESDRTHTAAANAQYIVRAVNNFDALVEACEALLSIVVNDYEGTQGIIGSAAAVVNAAAAALAAARAEGGHQ